MPKRLGKARSASAIRSTHGESLFVTRNLKRSTQSYSRMSNCGRCMPRPQMRKPLLHERRRWLAKSSQPHPASFPSKSSMQWQVAICRLEAVCCVGSVGHKAAPALRRSPSWRNKDCPITYPVCSCRRAARTTPFAPIACHAGLGSTAREQYARCIPREHMHEHCRESWPVIDASGEP